MEVTTSTIDKQQLICAYPKLAQYVGSDDINDAANFECKALISYCRWLAFGVYIEGDNWSFGICQMWKRWWKDSLIECLK